jgi:hypothetical protein
VDVLGREGVAVGLAEFGVEAPGEWGAQNLGSHQHRRPRRVRLRDSEASEQQLGLYRPGLVQQQRHRLDPRDVGVEGGDGGFAALAAQALSSLASSSSRGALVRSAARTIRVRAGAAWRL